MVPSEPTVAFSAAVEVPAILPPVVLCLSQSRLKPGSSSLQKNIPDHLTLLIFAYTNTYASLEYLETLYMEAITHPDIRILSIATRPDCLSEKILDLLENLNRIKPVWVELGLQTIHEESARYIRRGYELPVFENAVSELRKRGIDVIVHTILCLPNETEQDILKTIEYLNHQDIQGIKLQLLHVLKDTDLADIYLASPFYIPTPEEYYQLLGMCISHLRPDIVIHRLTGDGPKNLLIAPLWTCNKRQVLNQFQSYLKTHDIWQGKECNLGQIFYVI